MRLPPVSPPGFDCEVRRHEWRSKLCRRLAVLAGSLVVAVTGLAAESAATKESKPVAADIVLADFEGRDYGAWTVTGDAFGNGPAPGTLPNQMPVDGFQGHGLVNSFQRGDDGTGTLTSPPFRIERQYLRFLIGGGRNPEALALNLLVDGRVARSATGPNDRPGGSEHLDWDQWDLGDLAGRMARIQIVDQAKGGWGHLNVDQLVLTDRPLPAARTNLMREFLAERRYLNFPVRNGAPKRRVRVEVGELTLREFDIELADDNPDFWVFLNLEPFQGKRIVVKVDRLPADSLALAAIDQSDRFRGETELYRESLRPQIHFSSRRGWNNDPNGLVYYRGEYHLFYQHNPYGWDWGNMHWGHAVSPDLVHWRELPIALYPQRYDDWVFSGSAVVDAANTSGFKTGRDDVLVAAYTSTGRGESIAYSNDRGRTWVDYAGNPVVKHQGRDPRLFWHEGTRRWCMAVYDEYQGGRYIAFYSSADLKQWTFQSRIEGFFECPDIFRLPVDAGAGGKGKPGAAKWVLTAASSEYRLGQFDGREFVPETPKLPGHRGEAFYAAQTFSDMPDGRRVQIGWGQMPTPGMPFNQMMMFPCELTLRTLPDGVRLCWQPVEELARLRQYTHRIKDSQLEPGIDPLRRIAIGAADIQLEFEPAAGRVLTLKLAGVDVRYEADSGELVCKKYRVPLRTIKGGVRLQVLVDRTSLEIFGNDGEVYMPIHRPPPTGRSVELEVTGGPVPLRSLVVHELRSIWDR